MTLLLKYDHGFSWHDDLLPQYFMLFDELLLLSKHDVDREDFSACAFRSNMQDLLAHRSLTWT